MKAYFDIEQGSAEWFRIRSGKPTAGSFDQIITPKKQELTSARHKYACRLIAERLLNWQAESLDKIRHIEDGKTNEPYAVAQLELVCDIETQLIGFVTTNDGRFGASPDRVIMSGDRIQTSIEVKAPTIPKQMEYLLLGHDDAYICQVQGQLWVAEADKAIFYSYSPRMPAYMIETGRDEAFLRRLRDCLEKFSDELEEMTERARRLGAFQAFAEIVTPAEAELGPGVRSAPMETAEELAAMIEGDDGGRLAWGA